MTARFATFACYVALGFGTTVRAQSPIVTFDFATAVGNEATFNATAKDTNISNTPQISRANLTITAQQSGSEFSASGFTTSGTIVTSQYFSFTITPASGYDVNVSSIDVRTATQFFGPSTIELRSSAGTTPFSTTLATYSTNNTNPQNAQFNGFSVSGLNGTPLEFRIYGYGAGFAGSAFGFVSNMTAGAPGIVVNGTVTPVPEAETYVFASLGAGLVGCSYLRKRRTALAMA
ncbi:MAG: hypothetical protein U0746_18070 [Gemmataceae bacterium]